MRHRVMEARFYPSSRYGWYCVCVKVGPYHPLPWGGITLGRGITQEAAFADANAKLRAQ